MRVFLPWLTAALVLIADRLSKLAILDAVRPGSWIPVVPGLAITHVHNTGIAFSLFSDGGRMTRLLLNLFIMLAVVLIAWMVVRHGASHWTAGLAFGLVLGGAVGNLVDRILYGWVVDFIHVWVRLGDRVWSWPDFNVADSAITVGAITLIISELRGPREGTNAPDPD